MISKALVKQIERHSNRLTQEVLAAVRNDARTQAYHNLSDEVLREAVEEVFRHLGLWLTSRTDYAVESRYQKIGRKRYQEGIPLSQMIHAFTLVRATLTQFLRGATLGSAAELQLEHELALSISDFVEKAVYYASKGYEDARAAELASGELPEVDVSRVGKLAQAKEAWDPATEWDPNVSRGGDVGEVSG